MIDGDRLAAALLWARHALFLLERRFGGLCAGLGIDQFMAPHGLCVDSRGDLYVGEVSWTQWPQLFPQDPIPVDLRSLRKFRRVA